MSSKFACIILGLSSLTLNSYATTCTPAQQAPTDKPGNFDTNEHLRKFETAGDAINNLPGGAIFNPNIVRASVMASMFAPDRKYDLKNNPEFSASGPDEFGNYFYGMAAAALGYSLNEALAAADVIQQWQNYSNTNHPDAGDVGELASNIAIAVKNFDGSSDNPDDVAPITGGHTYKTEIFDNDSNAANKSDSCESNSDSNHPPSVHGGSYIGVGGGWSGMSFSGIDSCFGSACYIGVGSVRVTDLPPVSTN